MTTEKLSIQVNGEPRKIIPGTTIAGLLEELGKNPQYLAVEQNRQLIKRGDHSLAVLSSGDVIEIVTLVGGG